MKRFLICLFLLFATSTFAANSFPSPVGYVNDFAGLLNAEQSQALEQKLTQFTNSSNNEISIATLSTLNGDSIEHVAEQLFKQWGVGKRAHDNGVLIVVAPQERKMRIEVGYGLEGALTDAQSSWIIRNVMQPAFKAGDYYTGLDQALDQIMLATQGEYVPSETAHGKQDNNLENIIFATFAVLYFLGVILGRSKSYWAGGLIGAVLGGAAGFFFFSTAMALLLAGGIGFLGLIFDFIVSRMPKNNYRGGPRPPFWFGGGGGSGGFGGFGRGRSGGGGASGGW